MARGRHALVVVALASLFIAHGARAEDPREASRAAFRRGVTAAKAGDYVAARDAFLEAYKLFAHPSILLNLGIARTHTGELVDAEHDLARFLADDGGATAEEVQSARTGLLEVRRHLGTIRLGVAPDAARATVDGKPVALLPGNTVEVRVLEGEHDLRVEAEGYDPDVEHLKIDGGQEITKRVALYASARASEKPVVPPPDRTRAILGYSLVGAGVLAAGLGTYAGLTAISKKNEYNAQDPPQDASLRSSGVMFRTVADVSFLVALASAGAGAYFLFFPGPHSRAQIVVGPAYSGLRGTF